MPESTPAWKSTLLPVVAVVTYMNRGIFWMKLPSILEEEMEINSTIQLLIAVRLNDVVCLIDSIDF